MIAAINPWLLIGAASLILASFFGGVTAGKKLERTTWLQAQIELQAAADAETARANEVAKLYGTALSTSQDTAFKLRRKLNEQREQLASCIPGGGVRFTPAFTGLYNDALQTDARHPGQPVGEATGTDAATVLATHTENGLRWKNCRLQLNSLIDILEPMK